MDPLADEAEQLDGRANGEPGLPPEFLEAAPLPAPPDSPLAARRADIDTKQERLGELLDEVGCEGVVLLLPAHVAWFTSGLSVRGLLADSERPAVYTNGRQRWLLCPAVDTQRYFDEEIDRLGFQLKEWGWESSRADLLMTVTAGRKVAADRPIPNAPQVGERLRPLLRTLSPFERSAYQDLGRVVVHAVEAAARSIERGETEQEIAGQLAHRLLRRGAEPAAVSVAADGRGGKFRRAGFSPAAVEHTCVLQATAHRGGLYATASRTVSFGPPPADFRAAHDLALRLAAVFRLFSVPGERVGTAKAAAQVVLLKTPFEFDWRLAAPGHGAGRFPAEELRRAGQEEPFADGQAVVWQPRVGPAAAVDTVLVTPGGAEAVTPPEEWPYKRVTVRNQTFDIPDILVRDG